MSTPSPHTHAEARSGPGQEPRRDALSDARRALLERRLSGQPASRPRIARRPPDQPARASFAQERLWFLDQLNPGSAAYNMHEAFRLRGSLDVSALERAANALVRRHEALRTSFQVVDGELIQVIAEDMPLRVARIDARGATAHEVGALAASAARHRFDLAAGPMLHIAVAELGDDDHALFVTLHHIASDEWSNGILWRELAALYSAERSGAPAALPALPIQYADYAHWQRGALGESALRAQREFWRAQLAGELPLLHLPADRPRPPVQRFHGGLVSRALDPALAAGVRQQSQHAGVTPFMTLLAAFDVLLHRYSGQGDIIVGTPIANRNSAETESVIGLFLNTLALRQRVSGEMRFSDLLAQVRETALGAYAHQELPFEQVVDELQLKRDLSHNPIFQVMFVHQQGAEAALDLPGVRVEPLFVDGGVAKFDLTLFVVEGREEMTAAIEYASDLFDAATIERMLGSYEAVLRSIVANSDQRVDQLALLDPSQRRQVLVDWNDADAPYPTDRCIHALIEDAAVKAPHAPAVIGPGGQLSYAELDGRAEQLAHYLRSCGVRDGAPVGLCVQRSLEMIIGIVGILKAGGAYVPLDPAYPADRLAHALDATGAAVILTQAGVRDALPPMAARVIRLDADWAEIARGAAARDGVAADAPAAARPEQLAYIIFTSGSTGQPKGVPVTHRNLVASTTARFTYYPDPVGRFLLLSSVAFDSSVAGIFWALCQGGALVLPEHKQEQDVAAIAESIARHSVTHTLCLPSLYDVLLDYAAPGQLDTLKVVIVAGESCRPDLPRKHDRCLPGTALYNEYGPTEGTVWCTAYRIPSGEDRRSVPIGRPIPNARSYILDHTLAPVPIGVAGELYIGGAGVVAGYWKRPDLTAQRFVEFDPAPYGPRERLYKTGDLARWLPDGTIEFLGRTDRQVKIRGFRVELEEIESVLAQHPAVSEAVVVAQPNAAGDTILAAYASEMPESGVGGPALRSYLAQKLPAYLVPQAVMVLPTIPLTPNGKVDRNALPPAVVSDVAAAAGADRARVPPRNALEAEMIALWEALLSVAPVGATDDFFTLGGHSLLAARLFAEIERRYGVRLPVASMYREATPAHIAKLIGRHKGYSDWYSLIVIQMHGTRPPFYCVHDIDGCVGDYRVWAKYLGPDQPFFGLGARGFGNEPPFDSIPTMAAHYVDEVLSIQPDGPYFIGGYGFGGIVAFEMAQQLWAHGHADVLPILINTEAPGVNYRRAPVTWRSLSGFAANLPHWARDAAQVGAPDVLANLRRKLAPPAEIADVGAIPRFDHETSDVNQYKDLISGAHLHALRMYAPRIFPGTIVMLRTQRQPLWSSFAPDLGWGHLARGGVVTRSVPGSMTTILSRPDYAQRVSAALADIFARFRDGALRVDLPDAR